MNYTFSFIQYTPLVTGSQGKTLSVSDCVWEQVKAFLTLPALMPVFIACYVTASRVVDHRHSPADVTAGAGIGLFSAALFFARMVWGHGTRFATLCELNGETAVDA